MGNDQDSIDELMRDNPEMIEAFVTEAKEHLDTVEDDFLELEKQKEDPDKELTDKVFRAIHSVKAAVGFLGLRNMTKLAHVMETLLSSIRAGEIRPESECIDALLAGVDLLTSMLDDIEGSEQIDVGQVYERLYSLTGEEPPRDVAVEGGPSVDERAGATSPDGAAAEDEAQPAVLEKTGVDFGNTVRIQVGILDKLMVLAGELVLVRNRHLRAVDETDPVARSISQQLDMVTSELQETIIRTRMQPVGKIFGKFPRIVRELEKKLDKQIQLEVSGSEAELDKTILESLVDPLNHIIRNGCSHGLEFSQERVKAGKPKAGRIVVRAYHEAGRVNIEIRDDGRGIDPKLIREKVLEKGLKSEAELDMMGEREILHLVTLPGFSTVDKVSDVFGRGVGMDVVRTAIEKLGGSLELESVVGEGTTIHLRLPLTLAIIPCLIVSVGGQRYAIPQNSLEELVCLYDEDVKTKMECADDQEVFRLRDRILPMVRLSEILARPMPFSREVRAEITEKHRYQSKRGPQGQNGAVREEEKAPLDSVSFVVLKAGAGRFGLIVDYILGTEEIVVKPMHSGVKSLPIYSGATIMGDGQATLILDVEGIARHAGIIVEGRPDSGQEAAERISKEEDLQSVLLFKYGEKEQFALSLTLVRRIEPVAMSRVEKIGEREYITIDGTSTRILRLDQALNVSPVAEREEMFLILPRHIRQPVALLVAKLVDVEEAPVELNLETYVQDGILGTAIIRDSMTLFLDIYRLVEIIEPEWFAERRMGLFGTAGPPPESAKQILVVEDSPFFRYLIKGYLEADGYRVTTAENGRMGLDRMGETEFDLIVSDLDMPVMNGWEFVKKVRQYANQRDIPAIALTALDSEDDRDRAMASGFNRYEVKLDRERFLTSVGELIGAEERSS